MIDIHLLTTKLNFANLEKKVMDYLEKYNCLPDCLILNRDQLEEIWDLGGNISTLTYRGIPVRLYTEKKDDWT